MKTVTLSACAALLTCGVMALSALQPANAQGNPNRQRVFLPMLGRESENATVKPEVSPPGATPSPTATSRPPSGGVSIKMRLTQEPTDSLPVVGGEITYRVQISNQGDAVTVDFTNVLPRDTRLLSGAPADAVLDEASNTLRWKVNLAPNSETTLALRVTVLRCPADGGLTNTTRLLYPGGIISASLAKSVAGC
jgi:uncharacterized repeat protein (TIGR01451 family)